MRLLIAVAATVAIFSSSGIARAQDLDEAKTQFVKSCGTCHAVEANAPPRQGPNLLGIYGRKAASLPGYKYSAALSATDLVWTEETLDPWIANAPAMVPGTTMNYRQADAERRRKIIAYLKSLGPSQ